MRKHLINIIAASIAPIMLATPAYASGNDFSGISTPIVSLINSLLNPLLAVIGALGVLYCILLGVKYARAEEPQEQMKAKQSLKNAILGFILIFVLIVALRVSMPILTNWVNTSTSSVTSMSLK